MAERMKLKVTDVKEPQPIGDKGATKLSFKAKNGDGKDLQYFTFAKRLFESITKDAEIEVDVDVTTRETDSGSFVDRKVTEVYVDGKAIGQTPKTGYVRQDSPEQRESIEAQVAVKTILAVTNDTSDYFKTVYLKALAWCESRLDRVNPVLSKAPEKPGTEKAKEAPEKVGEGDSIKELLQWVMEKKKKGWTNPATAHTWIVNVCKIPAERIESDPEGVKKEIAELQGWT